MQDAEPLTTLQTPDSNGGPSVTVRLMTIDDIAPIYHLGERLFTVYGR